MVASPASPQRQASPQKHDLLEQIRTGASLRPTRTPEPSQQTLSRGGLLHEIQQRPKLRKVPVPVEASRLSKMQSSGSRSRSASNASTVLPNVAPSHVPGAVKVGWLKKRGENGIWQRRFFVLTPAALSYYHRLPFTGADSLTSFPDGGNGDDSSEAGGTLDSRAAALLATANTKFITLNHLHDVHATGTGGEFAFYNQSKRFRLKASNAGEASEWVQALIKTQDFNGQVVSGPPGQSAAASQSALLNPALSLSVHSLPQGERREVLGLLPTLLELARLLGEPQQVLNAIASRLAGIGEGGLQIPLLEMLEECQLAGRPLADLLRWSHHTVLQPAREAVSENLGGRLNSTLDRESWTMTIHFDETESAAVISVHHLLWSDCSVRRSAPLDDDAKENSFRYRLELALHFTAGTVQAIEKVSLHVVDYEFPASSDRSMRDEAKAALKPLCLPHLEYLQMWRRPLHRLPVHKDVPRLLKGVVVLGPHGEDIFRPESGEAAARPSQMDQLRSLFLGLSRALDSAAVVELVESRFGDFVPAASSGSGDVAMQLRAFLLESGLPEEALSVQVLKCVHQEMLFPAVSALRNSIYTIFPYRDVRGEWRVHIEIGADKITVAHKKWEQTHADDPRLFFKFRWCVSLVFDRRMRSLQGATVHVLDFSFGPETSDDQKHRLQALLKPWLAPGVLYKQIWNGLGSPDT